MSNPDRFLMVGVGSVFYKWIRSQFSFEGRIQVKINTSIRDPELKCPKNKLILEHAVSSIFLRACSASSASWMDVYIFGQEFTDAQLVWVCLDMKTRAAANSTINREIEDQCERTRILFKTVKSILVF